DSPQPAQRRESIMVAGEWISNESFVAGSGIAPPTFPLRLLRLIYEYSYTFGFHLTIARSGTLLHDEARIVRRTDPSSRSFLVSVGREMPSMRAAALRLPPVSAMVVWIASSTIAWSDLPSAGMRITPPEGVSTSGM